MRKINKYKVYQKIDLVSKFPLKILKFKRPKWFKIKTRFLNRTKPKVKIKFGSKLVDITYTRTRLGMWDKIKNSYKNKLNKYSFLNGLFGNSIRLKRLKSQVSSITEYKELYSKIYFENYYKSYVLAWLANLSSSPFESRQQISSKNLIINDKKASTANFLRSGDVVSIMDSNVNTEQVSKRYNTTLLFLSHTEIDYYSQNIAVIKDLSSLSKDDFLLLTSDYINMKILK